MRFEAPILHIRRRAARDRSAYHEDRSWLVTACARGLNVVERPSDRYDSDVRMSSALRTASYPRAVDSHRWGFGCVARNHTGRDRRRRPLDRALAGNHRRRSRPVRAGLMVDRRSAVRVEAGGTCPP